MESILYKHTKQLSFSILNSLHFPVELKEKIPRKAVVDLVNSCLNFIDDFEKAADKLRGEEAQSRYDDGKFNNLSKMFGCSY